MSEAKGRVRRMSDQELREALDAGMKPPAIAEKFEISTQNVYKRIKRLGVATIAAATAPAESRRFVGQQIDAIEELKRIIVQANLLGDACDEWLRDPDDPEKYSVGARSEEITVVYLRMNGCASDGSPRFEKKKAPLAALLAKIEDAGVQIESWEKKHADPRELILKAAQERRQTVSVAADLVEKLLNARRMEAFQEAFLAEVAKVDADVATRIAQRIRSHLLLCASLGGAETLSRDGGAAG